MGGGVTLGREKKKRKDRKIESANTSPFIGGRRHSRLFLKETSVFLHFSFSVFLLQPPSLQCPNLPSFLLPTLLPVAISICRIARRPTACPNITGGRTIIGAIRSDPRNITTAVLASSSAESRALLLVSVVEESVRERDVASRTAAETRSAGFTTVWRVNTPDTMFEQIVVSESKR